MTRTRKSQRKLDRKENFFDPNHRSKDSPTYNGYFGELLRQLDENFQQNQRQVKQWLGRKLADAIDQWHLAPREPMTAIEIFTLIQKHENGHYSSYGIGRPKRIPATEYATFIEISERLSFGYVAFAEYYLRKEQQAELQRSAAGYHSSYMIPIRLTHYEEYSSAY